MSSVYYPDYLQLDKILGAQALESDKHGQHAHDEMLFIVIHQAYELWFKQVLHEVGSVIDLFANGEIADNEGELNIAVHRLRRANGILQLLVKQIDIMETMTPLDFLDFRDMLRPASGFQSVQWKVLEARLGLKMEARHGKAYYTSQLKPEHKAEIERIEQLPTLFELVNNWLERMPFFDPKFWPTDEPPFWERMKKLYTDSLVQGEQGNTEIWSKLFEVKNDERRLSPAAARSALFIMLYRDQPIFNLPFQLLQCLLDIDESMATWRYRHMHMVHRTIGLRVGTGGSTGKAYLQGALDSHYIFQEIADLSSFLIERRKLPRLPTALRSALGFGG
jgi:tryptophan 2,3-dioxygenase